MAKGLAPVFFTACGVVVAGVAGYALFESQSITNNSQSAASESIASVSTEVEPKKVEPTAVAEDDQKLAKLDTSTEQVSDNSVTKSAPALETTVEPIEVLPVEPSFGLVRVERDGSAVIAGEGPANEVVELIDGQTKLAETKINTSGEFVFVLDEPLSPGAHELFLRVIPKDGTPTLSSSFAFVDVPKPKTIGEVTVLLAEAGKPTQLLQKPQDLSIGDEAKPESNVVTATAQSKITLAKPEQTNAEEINLNEETAAAPVKTKKTEASSLAPVLIEAADVENGKIFIAGTGEPLTSINIYLENDLLGSTQVAENGAFLFEGSTELGPGRYDIRADMTKGGANVLARAEVTLVHEPKVVADLPKEEPKEEVASVEPQVKTADEEQPVSPAEVVEEQEELIRVVEETNSNDDTKIKTEVEQTASIETPKAIEVEDTSQQDKKEIQTGSAVIIRRGDNLWTVARRNYGAGIRYTTIFDANRDQVRDPHRIYPGQVLKIPESEQGTE